MFADFQLKKDKKFVLAIILRNDPRAFDSVDDNLIQGLIFVSLDGIRVLIRANYVCWWFHPSSKKWSLFSSGFSAAALRRPQANYLAKSSAVLREP